MNFPMENPLFQFFYLLVNHPGLGGLIAGMVGGGSILAYALTLRWISQGREADEAETFAYPTPAFHHEAE